MAIKGEKIRDRILTFLQNREDETGFADIANRFRRDVSERTILRLLHDLIAKGLVMRRGEPKHYVYSAPVEGQANMAHEGHADAAWQPAETIPLSGASREILAYLDLPKEKRKPVGYNRAFLDTYIPGETHYLPEDTLEHLRRLGTVPQEPDDEIGATAMGRIYQRLLIDLSWASSHLEGNTYSLLDTKRLLELDEMAAGKDVDEATMILNHRDAIRFLIDNRNHIGIDRYTLTNLHAILSHDLMPDPTDEGRLRRRIVEIGQSVYLPPSAPRVVEEIFEEIILKSAAIEDPIELSFFLLVHLPYLQPFADVNKRTSRLAANIPLMKAGLAPLSFLDVPERHYIQGVLGVYETNRVDLLRDVFAWTYERSCAHYAAHRQELRVSDRKRLIWRQELVHATRQVVLKRLGPDDAAILLAAGADIRDEDAADFVRLVRENLGRLHEGNIARYGIGLNEYAAWKDQGKAP